MQTLSSKIIQSVTPRPFVQRESNAKSIPPPVSIFKVKQNSIQQKKNELAPLIKNGEAIQSGRGSQIVQLSRQALVRPIAPPSPLIKKNPVQPKLEIAQPNDRFEQEADQVANRIVSMPDAQATSAKGTERKVQRSLARSISFISPSYFSTLSSGASVSSIQRKETGNTGTASVEVESKLNNSSGRGSPMSEETRNYFEPRFGADFSGVRMHTDQAAVQMNKAMGSHAFAYGNNIYFNEGRFNPSSTDGKRLIAHELTHTIQQSGAVSRSIQRAGGKPKVKAATASSIDFDKQVITIKELRLPPLKARNKAKIPEPITRKKGYKREEVYDLGDGKTDKQQDEKWKESVASKVKTKVASMSSTAKDKGAYDNKTKAYYFNWEAIRLIGSEDTISRSSLVPGWNYSGLASAYDVDHVLELQLGGANDIGNMELLNFSANRASGSIIKNEIESQTRAFLTSKEAKEQAEEAGKKLPDLGTAKEKYDITFQSRKFNHEFSKGTGRDEYWLHDDITGAKHLSRFKPMSKAQIKKAQGSKDDPIVYTSEAGGRPFTKSDFQSMPGVRLDKFEFPDTAEGEQVGSMNLTVLPNSKLWKPVSFPIPIYKMEGVIFGGYMPRRGSKKGEGGLEKILSKLELNGLSPVTVDYANILPRKGLVVSGTIHPTLEIIKGFGLDFYIEGKDFGVSKTITSGDIRIPKPFKINDAYLTLFAGTDGFGVKGDVLFEIANVGSGKISGKAKTDGKFGIAGSFLLDKKLFKGDAKVDVEYDSEKKWKIHGELGFNKGVVKGLKSGNITVDYAQDVLKAEGTAEPDIKGFKEVTLKIAFLKDEFMIEGGVKVEKLPGIKEGEGTLKIVKKGNDYDFSGNGTIIPDIPGLSTKVNFDFQNKLFNVNAFIDYKRDRLSGTINLGITNRALGPDGKPTGEALPDYKVYGGALLSLKINDSLKVSAGAKFLENGEIEILGRIDLPRTFQVFPPLLKPRERKLVDFPNIHIPLFGIPLGVGTIGLEATIEPYIKASASIGAGLITNVFAEVKYNPSRPEDMSISGGAAFEMKMHAGLTAGIDFNIGISALVASLKGGIGLNASINVDAKQPIFKIAVLKWTPKTGFAFDGKVNAILQPTLDFNIDVHLTASALFWDKTWRHKLAGRKFSPGLDFGFTLPIVYQEGRPFNVSFSDIDFVYPEFDSGFLTKIKDQIVKPIKDEVF